MFPFEYEIDSDLIFGFNDFEFGNFGGNPVFVGQKKDINFLWIYSAKRIGPFCYPKSTKYSFEARKCRRID